MQPSRRHVPAMLAAFATALSAHAAWAAPRYHLVDIPTDDLGAYTTAINERGDVTFQSGYWFQGFIDYVYRKGVVEVVLPGRGADITGFNDRDDMVTLAYDQNFRASLGYLEQRVWAGLIEPSFAHSGVDRGGIADNRIVVASATVPGRQPGHAGHRCFRWRHGVTLAELGTQGDVCTVAAVSHRGVATGTVNRRPGEPFQAYVWAPGHFQVLGTLGGPTSTGTGANDQGHVALWSDLPPDAEGNVLAHAALFDGTTLVDLGTLPGDVTSYTAAMNSSDEILGTSRSALGVDRQFLYTGGRMLALDDLIDNLPSGTYYVNAINDRGEIAGTRSGPDPFEQHPFVLQRVSN